MSATNRPNHAGQSATPGQEDLWEACPTGEISRMADRIEATQRHRRRKQVFGTALASTALFACVVLVVGSLWGPSNSFYGSLACSQCRSHFNEYQAHLAGQAPLPDADLVSSMQIHLEKCVLCQGRFNALYPGLLTTSGMPATRPGNLLKMPTWLAMTRARPQF